MKTKTKLNGLKIEAGTEVPNPAVLLEATRGVFQSLDNYLNMTEYKKGILDRQSFSEVIQSRCSSKYLHIQILNMTSSNISVIMTNMLSVNILFPYLEINVADASKYGGQIQRVTSQWISSSFILLKKLKIYILDQK